MSDGTWTLLHMLTPLATAAVGGGVTGQVRELTHASSRKLGFSLVEHDTLSFDMIASSPQTAALVPLASDVLVFRDADPVQRFRITERQLAKDANGVLTASFSGVSYEALPQAWIVRSLAAPGDSTAVASAKDRGHRSWPGPTWPNATERLTAAQREQSLIAWTIFNDGQSLPSGNLGVSRGHVPTTAVARDLPGTTENFLPVEFLAEGTPRSEAITSLSEMSNGFEWGVTPDAADPLRRLLFHVWATDDGGRGRVTDVVLDDGGTVAGWSHAVISSDYLNVGRFAGDEAVPAVWIPTTRDPAGAPPEGRWERNTENSDWNTATALADGASGAFTTAHTNLPELTLELSRGWWGGPSQLWLGDSARVLINEPLPDGTGYLLYIDELVRIAELAVDVDDAGGEDLTLTINRPAVQASRDLRQIFDRLNKLERRRR